MSTKEFVSSRRVVEFNYEIHRARLDDGSEVPLSRIFREYSIELAEPLVDQQRTQVAANVTNLTIFDSFQPPDISF